MKELIYDEPVLFSRNNEPISFSDSELANGKKIYPGFYDLSKLTTDAEYRVGMYEDWIVEITLEEKELEKLDENSALVRIYEEDGRLKANIKGSTSTTIAKTFAISDRDVDDFFVIYYRRKGKNFTIDKIVHLENEVTKHDSSTRTDWRILNKEELGVSLQENLEYQPSDLLYRVGVNYDGKPLPNQLNPMNLRLPFDTLKAVDFDERVIDNFSLYLFKAAIFKTYDAKKIQSKYDPKVLDGWNKFGITLKELLFLQNRQKQQAESLYGQIFSVPIGQLEDRMALGLGDAAAYENGIRLHHLYGFPYIPASSLKGVVRSYLIQEHFGTNVDSEAQAFYQDQGFCDIFGCSKDIYFGDKKPKEKLSSFYKNSPIHDFEEKMGEVYFFDAFPTNIPELKVDIMNPHYGPYYSEGKPPADYHNPVPVFFLTVTKTGFNFFFGLKTDRIIEQGKFSGKKISEVVKESITSALTNHGIGAKTAVGYGYMKSDT